MSEYKIQGESLTALADQVRLMTKKEYKMTISEMISALGSVTVLPIGTVGSVLDAQNLNFETNAVGTLTE